MVDTILQDLRYALRTLQKSPGFTAAVVLTLSLGIGVNTAIFSIVNALLLRDLPHVTRAEELLLIGRTINNDGFDTFSYPDYVDLRDQSRVFQDVAAITTVPVHVSGTAATERVRGGIVSGNYFAVLGTSPAQGRFFSPDDDRPSNPVYVVVLSAGLWQRAFGGRADVVGKTIRVDNHPFEVIGVAPAGFQGLTRGDQLDLFLPLSVQPVAMPEFGSFFNQREAVWLQLFGRLRPGASLAQARTDLAAFGQRMVASFPKNREGWGVSAAMTSGFDPFTQANIVRFLRLLQGAVILVLAIACANVANLLLVRSAARRRELAIRASLGAGRNRILRQLLTESIVLSALGGIGGLLLAYWGSDLLRALPAFSFSGEIDLTPDTRVLLFTLAISLAAAVLFGLVPAMHAVRSDLAGELRQGAEIGRPRGTRLRNALVITQVAVSLVLLVAAGLFVRTLQNAYAIDPGFATNVLVARLDVGLQGYDEARGRRFYTQLLRDLEATPGVRSASLALNLPFAGGYDTRIDAQGALIDAEHQGYRTDRNSVSPGYFETMGITTWGGPPLEVVGVARDAKYRNLFEERRLTFYQPLTQDYHPALVVHLRPAGDPMALVSPLQRAVRALDSDLPVYRIQPLDERLAGSLSQQRTAATLVGGFGALALLLAAIGLYGAVAYSAVQRTREFGIRIALGAQSPDVLRQVLREGVMLGVVGLAIGLVIAFAATRVLRSQLFGVSPTDPASFTAVSLVLLVVAVLASYVPARRATRVDPMVALRAE